jgi:hypothetical protein
MYMVPTSSLNCDIQQRSCVAELEERRAARRQSSDSVKSDEELWAPRFEFDSISC